MISGEEKVAFIPSESKNGTATWQISAGRFLMMWSQKVLVKATNSADLIRLTRSDCESRKMKEKAMHLSHYNFEENRFN